MITQRCKLLLAQATLALTEELGRRPTDAELRLLRRVLVRAMMRIQVMRSLKEKRNHADLKGDASC